MSSIILVIHIALALAALGSSIAVVIRPQGMLAAVRGMWASFAGVVLTGSMLVLAHPGSLGKLCLMSSVYVVVLAIAQRRYQVTFS
ncbi:TPA: hypothetical protein DIV49_00590 [Candidatus Saccharibacteria bacterium]|nr:hypothetical protein [Candidatus Saccharibacteria bacterium]HRJ91125.1 hypothetical protein [Candidatus Saccharibacteria bacterium]